MAKAPVAGRSKTRLGRDIGAGAATAFARHALRITLLRLAFDPRWETIVSVAPRASISAPVWPRGVARVAQTHGDLGQRMQDIFARQHPGPVVIVGSDIPSLRPSHVARAFRALGAADVVFGPASDGGYWLVGMKRRPRCPSVFDRVRWSSPHALADTRANCAGLSVAVTDTLADVDDAADLTRNAGSAGRLVLRRG